MSFVVSQNKCDFLALFDLKALLGGLSTSPSKIYLNPSTSLAVFTQQLPLAFSYMGSDPFWNPRNICLVSALAVMDRDLLQSSSFLDRLTHRNPLNNGESTQLLHCTPSPNS